MKRANSTEDDKVSICKRAYKILTEQANFPPEDIIFDPNILTVATGIEEHDNYAVDFINAVRRIKDECPGAKTSGGVSNTASVSEVMTASEKRCTAFFTTLSKLASTWGSRTPRATGNL